MKKKETYAIVLIVVGESGDSPAIEVIRGFKNKDSAEEASDKIIEDFDDEIGLTATVIKE